jgi:hypothetical protein
LIWDASASAIVLVLAGLGLLGWLANAYIWVRVPALEAALVFNAETKAFVRYLYPGRHFLFFPWERIEERLSLTASSVRGKCTQAQTNGGITVTVNWSLTYIVNPDWVDWDLWPRLAHALPHYANQMARNHGNNCVARMVSELPVEALTDAGARGRMERQLRDRIGERVRPFGLQLFRVMLLGIELPVQVQATLEAAHERVVHANSEAQALERLHRAVSQFSDAEMAWLIQLEQVHALGQNGVSLPVMMHTFQSGGQSPNGGAKWDGHKPPNGPSTGLDSGRDWPSATH